MSKDRFVRLIEEFCQLTKLDEPARIVRGGAIELDEVSFSLLHSEKINPRVLLVYCEYGTPPSGHEAEACRILLEKNMFRYDGDGGPVFTMSAAGKILCAQRLLLADAKAQQLYDLLSGMAEKARQWRKDYRMGKQSLAGTSHHGSRRPVRFAAVLPQP